MVWIVTDTILHTYYYYFRIIWKGVLFPKSTSLQEFIQIEWGWG